MSTEVRKDPLDGLEADTQKTGQVLLAEGSALHQRLVYQTVNPYPPQGHRAFLSEHVNVMLVQECELD